MMKASALVYKNITLIHGNLHVVIKDDFGDDGNDECLNIWCLSFIFYSFL